MKRSVITDSEQEADTSAKACQHRVRVGDLPDLSDEQRSKMSQNELDAQAVYVPQLGRYMTLGIAPRTNTPCGDHKRGYIRGNVAGRAFASELDPMGTVRGVPSRAARHTPRETNIHTMGDNELLEINTRTTAAMDSEDTFVDRPSIISSKSFGRNNVYTDPSTQDFRSAANNSMRKRMPHSRDGLTSSHVSLQELLGSHGTAVDSEPRLGTTATSNSFRDHGFQAKLRYRPSQAYADTAPTRQTWDIDGDAPSAYPVERLDTETTKNLSVRNIPLRKDRDDSMVAHIAPPTVMNVTLRDGKLPTTRHTIDDEYLAANDDAFGNATVRLNNDQTKLRAQRMSRTEDFMDPNAGGPTQYVTLRGYDRAGDDARRFSDARDHRSDDLYAEMHPFQNHMVQLKP